MLDRCENPDNSSYADYGGRGIRVCGAWHDFMVFLSDMGRRPSPDSRIERVDNDGPYAPDNCVWAGATAQARNRRSNLNVTIGGVTKCLRAWAEDFGHATKAQYKIVWQRVSRGWDPLTALQSPTRSPEVSASGS